MATKLLKIGGKKKRKKEKRNQLWQPSCQNWRGEKRENKNCGNQVAENGRKKKEETNCGNQVAEIEGVRREKIRIVATKLPKMGGKKEKKKNCGRNLIVI